MALAPGLANGWRGARTPALRVERCHTRRFAAEQPVPVEGIEAERLTATGVGLAEFGGNAPPIGVPFNDPF